MNKNFIYLIYTHLLSFNSKSLRSSLLVSSGCVHDAYMCSEHTFFLSHQKCVRLLLLQQKGEVSTCGVVCCMLKIHVMWFGGNRSAHFCLATSTTKYDKPYINRLMPAYYQRLPSLQPPSPLTPFEWGFRISSHNSSKTFHWRRWNAYFSLYTNFQSDNYDNTTTTTSIHNSHIGRIIIISCECGMTAKNKILALQPRTDKNLGRASWSAFHEEREK